MSAIKSFFQIADLPIYKYIQNWSDYRVTSIGETLKAVGSSYTIPAYTPDNFSPKRLDIDLVLYNDGYYTEADLAQALMALQGRVVEVIAYEKVKTEFTRPCPCATCEDCTCDCLLLWYTNWARIFDVTISSSDWYGWKARISIEIGPFWEVMNRYIWEVQLPFVNGLAPYEWNTPVEELFPYQDCYFLEEAQENCYVFRKKSPITNNVFYDPAWLALEHEHGEVRYPQTGYWRDFNMDNSIRYIDVDKRFSAPSKYLYLFRFLNGYNPTRNWQRKTIAEYELYNHHSVAQIGTIVFDWSMVNEIAIANGHVWDDNDILVYGSVNGTFVVMRDYEILFHVSAAVHYTTQWRGEVRAGRNQIRFRRFGGFEVAIFHTYRVY